MEMAKYEFNIEDLLNGRLTIIPIGDIQWAGDSNSIALRLLNEKIERGQKDNAFYLGMGDYIDFVSPSNRKRLTSAQLYDTAMDVIDQAASRLTDEVSKILEPTRGRWLGLLEGHHFHQFLDGRTSDMVLAEQLRTRHLGSLAYIGLTFKYPNSTKCLTVNLWATHGCGSGTSAAAPVTKLERMVPAFEADIYLMGHMTKQAHSPVDRVYPTWGKTPNVKHRDIHLVGTGGFSKGYIVGSRNGQVPRGSYVEQGMMRPTVLGAPSIHIEPYRNTSSDRDILDRRITIEL